MARHARAAPEAEPPRRLLVASTPHEVRLDVLLAQVSGDRLRRTSPRAREQAVVIRQAGLLPARLRVAQKVVVRLERELYGVSAAVLVERLRSVPNALGSVI